MKDVARRYSKGRIVSCLEGGYMMGALARSVEAHVRVLADPVSPLCHQQEKPPL
jgi:acetoin utilization deacetylase AcuC-like enzyme